MSQEQQQRFTNRTVVGVLVVCLVGIALCSVALVPSGSVAADTATASPAGDQVDEPSGVTIPRWVLPVVALLGSFVAVGYVGAKGYAIVEASKQ